MAVFIPNEVQDFNNYIKSNRSYQDFASLFRKTGVELFGSKIYFENPINLFCDRETFYVIRLIKSWVSEEPNNATKTVSVFYNGKLTIVTSSVISPYYKEFFVTFFDCDPEQIHHCGGIKIGGNHCRFCFPRDSLCKFNNVCVVGNQQIITPPKMLRLLNLR